MKSFFLALRFALNNLRSNMGRTVVTLSGIIVSIAAIIVVSGAGESVKRFILGQIEVFGSDLIQVEPRVPSRTSGQDRSSESASGASSITSLTLEDAEKIERLPNVVAVYGAMIGQSLAQYREVNKQVFIFGTGADVVRVDENIKLQDGTFYTRSDDASLYNAVVLGSSVKETFFGNNDAVGKKIKIKGDSYTVVGVLEPRGSAGFFDFDSIVYMPIQTLQKKILGIDHVSMVSVRVSDVGKIDQTSEDIRWLLRDRHDITDVKDDDFEVMSVKEAQETVANVFGTINILLIALASISLTVGGVGIMNVMFVAVSERTSEIGLRKAVGGRSRDVLGQFLVESTTIALLGGIFGIVLGILFLYVGIMIAQRTAGFSVEFILTFRSLLLAVGFSGGAGILFGMYPAWRASKISPVQALTKE